MPTLAPDQLVPGQKAEVRTVFAGHRIESFDAEILGVLKAGRAGGDMILARATSDRVIRSGIAAGMSGSPVYVDGRLIGALSSGWPFTRDAIFGITPIGEMLDVLDHPMPPPDAASAGPAGVAIAGGESSYRELHWSGASVARGAPSTTGSGAAPVSPALEPLPIPLIGVGLAPAALDMARTSLAPFRFSVLPGGKLSGVGADSLGPGSAVAVDLMRGDLQLSAIGTVTWRDGDRVLIFGHPFFQAGAVRMPLSTAEITTIVASDLNSFKLGATGDPIGVVNQDRRAAVSGTLGQTVRLLPLRVTLHGGGRPTQTFRFETIEDRSIAPALISIATFSSLMESGGTAGNQTLSWRLTFFRKGQSPVALRDITSGDSPPATLAQQSTAPLAFLFNNPFQPLSLDSLTIDVERTEGRERWSLEDAVLLTPVVRPGGVVRVRCSLRRWRGDTGTRDITLTVPEEAKSGRYDVWVGGGHELSALAAKRQPGHFQPESLAETWGRLLELPPADGLHAVLFSPTSEWTRGGRDYPGLPGSARSLLAGAAREGSGWLAETQLGVEGYLSGQTQLRVVVDDLAP